jgi:methionyl-tRNA formyltransferase
MGSGPVAAASLKYINENFDVSCVVTKQKAPHHKEPAEVEEYAKAHGLTTYFANTKSELNNVISQLSNLPELGIIIDYGVIVSEEVINKFRKGIINSHFSLLPEWRGADPITFSILSGQKKTGVSLMVIDQGLDTGKLIAEESMRIGTQNSEQLTDDLVNLSNQMLSKYLPVYYAGELLPYSQSTLLPVTYSRKLTKDDASLDFNRPASVLEREIRAFSTWPKSKTEILDIPVIVTKAMAATEILSQQITFTKNEIKISTPDGCLVIHELKPNGKNVMPAQSFINGYVK